MKCEFLCWIRDQTLPFRWRDRDFTQQAEKSCASKKCLLNLPVVCRKDRLKLVVVYPRTFVLSWLSESWFCLATGLTVLCLGNVGPEINDEKSKPIIAIPSPFASGLVYGGYVLRNSKRISGRIFLSDKKRHTRTHFPPRFCISSLVKVILGGIAAILRPWGGRQNKQNSTRMHPPPHTHCKPGSSDIE